MKKNLIIFVLVFFVTIVAITLFACNQNKKIEPKEQTINVSTVEDFMKIRDMVGLEYSKTTFNILNDIDLTQNNSNWLKGIGSENNPEKAFTGTIKGNNHTITYKTNIATLEPELENTADPIIEPIDVFGLFSYTYNATFKDLKIKAQIVVPSEAKNTTIGGLSAVSNGKTILSNVDVSGEILVNLRDLRRPTVYPDGSIVPPNTHGAEYNKFYNVNVGGVIGQIKGEYSLSEVSSSVNINVEKNKFCMINNLSIGGVVAIARPENISISNDIISKANNITYLGKMNFSAAKVFAGGVFGSVHFADIKKVQVAKDVLLEANPFERISYGGIAGLLENSKLEVSKMEAEVVKITPIFPDKKVSFDIGGIAGKTKNSKIDYCLSDTIIEVKSKTYFCAGGLVGVCLDSDLSNSASKGVIQLNNNTSISILNEIFSYEKTSEQQKKLTMFSLNGGVIGHLLGQSKISGKVASEFISFHKTVARIDNRLEIVKLKKGQKALDEWIVENKYDKSLMDIKEMYSKDAKEDEQQYEINHKPTLLSETVLTYKEENAKVVIDRAKWQAQHLNLEISGYGAPVEDEVNYNEIVAEINAKFEHN